MFLEKSWKIEQNDVISQVQMHFFDFLKNTICASQMRSNYNIFWCFHDFGGTVASRLRFPTVFVFLSKSIYLLSFRTKNLKFWCFCVFFPSRSDTQGAGRLSKLLQNSTLHKTTSCTALERHSQTPWWAGECRPNLKVVNLYFLRREGFSIRITWFFVFQSSKDVVYKGIILIIYFCNLRKYCFRILPVGVVLNKMIFSWQEKVFYL